MFAIQLKQHLAKSIRLLPPILSAIAAAFSAYAATRSADAASQAHQFTKLSQLSQSVAARNVGLYAQRLALMALSSKPESGFYSKIQLDVVLSGLDAIRYDAVDQRMIEPLMDIKRGVLIAKAYVSGSPITADAEILALRSNLSAIDAVLRTTGHIAFGRHCTAQIDDYAGNDESSCSELRAP
ncbi:hypothetical protein [Tardiphaga sp. 768_D3_N2_1]|uniref:hypothetical protein n=1 Tax=Tardiphaga sp. 768_D3_N2_1 TaxID=3240783 RepID=UPI003F8B8088